MAEKITRKRAGKSTEMSLVESGSSSASGAPCGACKFLRRRCVNGCIFAPYFTSEQGSATFAAVHKVFGASNVAKLLEQLPEYRRQEASATVSYEAQARLADPVFGCVKIIMELQQQVVDMQMKLELVRNQLFNSRRMAANKHQRPVQQFRPVNSNGSSAYNLPNDHQNAGCSQTSFDPQFSQAFGGNKDKEEETVEFFADFDGMFPSK